MIDDKILYLCDRCACEKCNPCCKHTTKIEHAKNFAKLSDDESTIYVEREQEPKSFLKRLFNRRKAK